MAIFTNEAIDKAVSLATKGASFILGGEKTLLNSNRAINSIASHGRGFIGPRNEGLGQSLSRAFRETPDDLASKVSSMKVARGAAAGYIGASAVGRVATGGGLYKDSNGNADIIGVPFI